MTDTSGSEFHRSPSTAGGAGLMEGSRYLEPANWSELPGFLASDHRLAFSTFQFFCRARQQGRQASRPTTHDAGVSLDAPCSAALNGENATSIEGARAFFEAHFRPWRVRPTAGPGFLTGYYEPVVGGSRVRTAAFTTPVLARPDDLASFPPGQNLFPDEEFGVDPPFSAAKREPDGRLVPYASRAAIESGAIDARTRPLLWLRDAVEVFFIQVQGSGRVRMPDGTRVRVAYDGRNGHPYTSIGRIVVEEGLIPIAEMSLARLKGWLRAHPAEAKAVMQRNRSYVFFKILEDRDPEAGPVGGAGVNLTPLSSIAVDRHLWAYGLPFWIDARLPWRTTQPEPFRRLMIAEDTGSAILGPARADIFFGSGETAGERAGDIRHPADFFVLLPKDDAGR